MPAPVQKAVSDRHPCGTLPRPRTDQHANGSDGVGRCSPRNDQHHVDRRRPTLRIEQEPSVDVVVRNPEGIDGDPALQAERRYEVDRGDAEPQRATERAPEEEAERAPRRAEPPAAIEHVERQCRQRDEKRGRQMRHRQRCIGQGEQDGRQTPSFGNSADREREQRQHDIGGKLGEGAAVVVIEQVIRRCHVAYGTVERDPRRRGLRAQPGMHGQSRCPQQHQRGQRQAIRNRRQVERRHAQERVDPEGDRRVEVEGWAAQTVEGLGQPARIKNARAELIGELFRPGEVLGRTVRDHGAEHQGRRHQQRRHGQQDQCRAIANEA